MVSIYQKLFHKTASEAVSPLAFEHTLTTKEFEKEIHSKYPIKHLNSRHKRWIVDISGISIHQPDELIFKVGEYASKAVYLLKGSLHLVARDDKTVDVLHSDESALYPIARTNPRQYTAYAAEPNTILLWVDRKLIKSCIANQLRDKTSASKDSYKVEIVSEEELANESG